MSGLLAQAVSLLILRLELAAERCRLARELLPGLELAVREGSLQICRNLDVFLERIKSKAASLDSMFQSYGSYRFACVLLSRDMTVRVIDIKCKEMLDNIQWQKEAGLKLITVEDFEFTIRMMQAGVIRGDWSRAVAWLNRNRVG